MKVAVFGLGYVGTVTAACLAGTGHDVWGVDPDGKKVEMIEGGTSPVVEPGLQELVAKAHGEGSLHASTDPSVAVAQAEVSLVCVGTPSSPSGHADLDHLLRAVKEIAQSIVTTDAGNGGFHSVVVRSTVPPGTVEERVIPVLEAEVGTPHGERFGAAMCPEFLREGSGVRDFWNPPFTVLGTSAPAVASSVGELFGFLEHPVRVVPVRTAEALKYACNAFHAVKVSFTNELSRLFRTLEVDSRTVMDIFCEDDHLNISPSYLRPGFAFGGSCLPKDMRSLLHLARMNSVELPLLDGAMRSNQVTIDDVVDRALRGPGRNVALLGLSFKPQTDDLRESPNVALAETLLGKGFEVRIYDPVVQPSRLMGSNLWHVESKLPHLRRLLRESPGEALQGADIALVSSTSDEVSRALASDPPPLVIDLVGRLGDDVERLPGYEGVGW